MNEQELERFRASLARHRSVRPTDEFRARLRADLMAAPVPFAPARPRGLVAWLRPALVAATLVALVIGGTGAAAASSLPGEPAFALKRAFEDVQLSLAGDDASRAELAVAIADRRLVELQATAATRPDLVEAAASAYADAWVRASTLLESLRAAPPTPASDAALEHASSATGKHEAVLDDIEDRVPEAAKDGIERAREASERAVPGGGRERTKPTKTPKPAETDEDRAGGGDGDKDRNETDENTAPAVAPTTSSRPRATETQRPERTETPEPTRRATASPSRH